MEQMKSGEEIKQQEENRSYQNGNEQIGHTLRQLVAADDEIKAKDRG